MRRTRPFPSPFAKKGLHVAYLPGFPSGHRAQVDLVPEDPARLRAVARRQRWKLTGPKKVLLISGEDRIGAMVEIAEKLAGAKINIVATGGGHLAGGVSARSSGWCRGTWGARPRCSAPSESGTPPIGRPRPTTMLPDGQAHAP